MQTVNRTIGFSEGSGSPGQLCWLAYFSTLIIIKRAFRYLREPHPLEFLHFFPLSLFKGLQFVLQVLQLDIRVIGLDPIFLQFSHLRVDVAVNVFEQGHASRDGFFVQPRRCCEFALLEAALVAFLCIFFGQTGVFRDSILSFVELHFVTLHQMS